MELGSFPKPRCIYFANSLSSLIKTSKPQVALFVRLSILLLLVVLYQLSFPVAKLYHSSQTKKNSINKRGGLYVITLTAVNKTHKT